MKELMIPLDANKKEPLYMQIYTYIKKEVKEGRLKVNSKLPSSRALAEELRVSRSTINQAYELLEAEGYLYTKSGSGCYVSSIESLYRLDDIGRKAPTHKETIKKAEALYDFSPYGIDLEHFPFDIWRKINQTTLNYANKDLFMSGHPQGEEKLREVIADYLFTARGVRGEAKRIIIGAGSEYLLFLIHLLIGNTTVIAMENPTYKKAYASFIKQGHTVVPIPVKDDGMDVDCLNQSLASIAYVMPSHQYPTGVIMSKEKRQELLAWADKHKEHYIIEDDYDSEFRYVGRPIPSLSSIAKHDKVIYIGTFSKAIAPGIRMSYMVLPEALYALYEKKYKTYASSVSRIDQEVVCSFIKDGFYERHLNKMRNVYRQKHDVLINELKPLAERFVLRGENAGLHIILEAKDDNTSEQELIRMARDARIQVYGLKEFEIVNANHPPSILLGFANLTNKQIKEGTRLLIKAWE